MPATHITHPEEGLGAALIEDGARVDLDDTRNEIRVGKLALIKPVMTSTEGRCVARSSESRRRAF